MAAGFAKNLEAEDLERGTHEIFVRSRSGGRQALELKPADPTRRVFSMMDVSVN
jgi:hypothetical protein